MGDAGHHKEFVIGDGITEALLQARSLAAAIAQGTDAALIRWWRARDVEALPFFFLGQDEGALGPPSELQQVVFARAAKVPALRARLAATMEHRLSPTETFPVRHVLWWALAAALRGSPRVLPQFIAKGKRGSAIDRELASASTTSRRGGGRRGTRHTARHEPGERSSAASRGIQESAALEASWNANAVASRGGDESRPPPSFAHASHRSAYSISVSVPVATSAADQIRSRLIHARRRMPTPSFSNTSTAMSAVTAR